MIVKIKTGHMYRNSAHETADSCGNCDGARCHNCVDIFEFNGERYDTYEEAKKVEDVTEGLLKVLLPELSSADYEISDIPEDYEYHIIDGKLCIRVWKRSSFIGDTDWGLRSIPCNEESPMYAQKLEGAIERLNQYNECTCTDKEYECSLGCPDKTCYREMKAGKRTEKKWYM